MAFSDLVAATDRVVQSDLGGASVVYAPTVGVAVTVVGMFDDNYTPTSGAQSKYGNNVPSVVLRLEDLPEDPRTARPTITISGQTYTTRGQEMDGVEGGSIRLFLRETP